MHKDASKDKWKMGDDSERNEQPVDGRGVVVDAP